MTPIAQPNRLHEQGIVPNHVFARDVQTPEDAWVAECVETCRKDRALAAEQIDQLDRPSGMERLLADLNDPHPCDKVECIEDLIGGGQGRTAKEHDQSVAGTLIAAGVLGVAIVVGVLGWVVS